jgi:hypothetical protein
MPVNVDPLVTIPKKGFGLLFMDAQYIKTKTLKMLNGIQQAPQYMYSSVLKWAHKALPHTWIESYSLSLNKRLSREQSAIAT